MRCEGSADTLYDAIIAEDGTLLSGQGLGVAFDFQAQHIYHATAG